MPDIAELPRWFISYPGLIRKYCEVKQTCRLISSQNNTWYEVLVCGVATATNRLDCDE